MRLLSSDRNLVCTRFFLGRVSTTCFEVIVLNYLSWFVPECFTICVELFGFMNCELGAVFV